MLLPSGSGINTKLLNTAAIVPIKVPSITPNFLSRVRKTATVAPIITTNTKPTITTSPALPVPFALLDKGFHTFLLVLARG